MIAERPVWDRKARGAAPRSLTLYINPFSNCTLMKVFFTRWSWVILCFVFLVIDVLTTMVLYKIGDHEFLLLFGVVGIFAWGHNLVREFIVTVRNRTKDRYDTELS